MGQKNSLEEAVLARLIVMFSGKLIYRRSCNEKIVCEFRFGRKKFVARTSRTVLSFPRDPFFTSATPHPPIPFLEIKCKFLYYSRQFCLISRQQSCFRIIRQLHTRGGTRLKPLLLSGLHGIPFDFFHQRLSLLYFQTVGSLSRRTLAVLIPNAVIFLTEVKPITHTLLRRTGLLGKLHRRAEQALLFLGQSQVHAPECCINGISCESIFNNVAMSDKA